MRDPARIDGVLEAIRRVWVEHPDMRLGQLLFNAVRLSERSDLYNIEDTVLIRKLEMLAERLRRPTT